MRKKSTPAPTFDLPPRKGMARILGGTRTSTTVTGRRAPSRSEERRREPMDQALRVPRPNDSGPPPRRGEG